jgi:hypothetical protein
MSGPLTVKKLLVEDFPPEQQEWIAKLLQPINLFIEQVNFALINDLTLQENARAQVRTVTFNGNATIHGDLTSGSPTITNVDSTVSLTTGVSVIGTGIPSGATISGVSGDSVTLDQNATATSVGDTFIVGNNFPVSFQYTLNTSPYGVIMVELYENQSNPEVIPNANRVDWELLNGQIVINHISGLKLNTPYSATFLVLGE